MGNPGQGSNIRGKDPLEITLGSGPFWQDHGIDHMDDAIAGNDICLDDRRIIDPDTVCCVDSNTLALDGFSTAQLDHICSHDLALHHVIEEDTSQGLGISEQGIHGTLGQGSKGLIGGSEHGERSRTLQGAGQAGHVQGRQQSAEGSRILGDLYKRRRRLEEALAQHPAVAFVGAIGQPDVYSGEMPCAYVELKDGVQVDAEELKEFATQAVSERAARPALVTVMPELPKTAVGKIYQASIS